MEYVAIDQHRSDYPEPASFAKGTFIIIEKKYEGPEGWDNWYFCAIPNQPGGWVPDQIIERLDDRHGKIQEDYTARELNINKGDTLIGSRILNGWLWCSKPSSEESGWVPLKCLQKRDT